MTVMDSVAKATLDRGPTETRVSVEAVQRRKWALLNRQVASSGSSTLFGVGHHTLLIVAGWYEDFLQIQLTSIARKQWRYRGQVEVDCNRECCRRCKRRGS